MNNKKKFLFVTGTRADFGKIKSIIKKFEDPFECFIFVTGMHLVKKYGYTVNEIYLTCKKSSIYKFDNQSSADNLDNILSKTIDGFSKFLKKIKPDLVIIHGDRIETLASAISCSVNNYLVAHIEGGELSGSIDEHIRHAVSKLSHLHFVSNQDAKKKLLKMGENKKSIFVVGSPDFDLMKENMMPPFVDVKKKYNFNYNKYAISILHPVTINKNTQADYIKYFKALIDSKLNYLIIYPNNDPGNELIIKLIKKKLFNRKNFKILPSMRFEYFLRVLKNADFIIGNSSAGIREAPYFGLPSINVGDRQQDRFSSKSIKNIKFNSQEIGKNIKLMSGKKYKRNKYFGNSDSSEKIFKTVNKKLFWKTSLQKKFYVYDM